MSETLPPPPNDPHIRWRFIRDILVFQLKLVLGNLQNFVLVPVSLVAAGVDLFVKGKHEGERFYWVMEWGRRTDEMINVYGSIGGYHATGGEDEHPLVKNLNVDALLARVEGVIVREYEKGGTAASIKGAVDRAIDEMQAHGDKGKAKFDGAFQSVTEKFKPKPEPSPQQDQEPPAELP
ncbi:MAG TPA: hypothetical protein VIJ85_10850 [Rhizomicrobium sp.]